MTLNVNLTPELEAMVRDKVATGLYSSASEVVREALRLMEEKDRFNAAVRVLENNNGNRNMPRVRKTVLAEQDLEEIWLYIAADNIVAADALIDKLVEKSFACRQRRTRPRTAGTPRRLAQLRGRHYILFYRAEAGVSSLHACCTVPVTSMPYCFRRDSE